MARGITEHDVHQAADELLGAGDRPTVERVRAHLGTGSPNTVTRWLETWWKALGSRLSGQVTLDALPGVPEQVAALAQRCWHEALTTAGEHASSQVAMERQALEDDRQAFSAERSNYELDVATLRQAAKDAAQAQRLAEASQSELREQLLRITALGEDLQQQRDNVLARADRAEAQAALAQQALGMARETAERERAELNEHIRAVEDRAYNEIDRLRQQLAAAEREKAAAGKRHATESARQEQALQAALHAAAAAANEAKLQTAVADATRQQLTSLQAVPTQMAELRKLISQRSGHTTRPRKTTLPVKVNPGGTSQAARHRATGKNKGSSKGPMK